MNKLTKLLTAIVLAGTVAATGFALTGCDPEPQHKHTYHYVSDGESGHHQDCVDGDATKDTVPHNFNSNGVCADCGYTQSAAHVHDYDYVNNGESGHHKVCKDGDSTIANEAHTFGDDNVCIYCGYTKPAEHEHYYEYVSDGESGHHQECTAGDDTTDTVPHNYGDGNVCLDCGYEKTKQDDEGTRTAVFELIPDELETMTYADGYNVGIFKILPGTTIRGRSRLDKNVYYSDGSVAATGFSANKSIQYNGTNVGFGITAPAAGKLTMYLDNGSSGLAEGATQTIVLTKPDGTKVDLSYLATDLRCVEIELEEAGYYTITRGSNGTTDIYYVRFEAEVSVTPVASMEVANPGITEFLLGQDLDLSQLQVQITYESGMVEPVALNDSRLVVDTSSYNKDVPGTYGIKIQFTDDAGKVFVDSYKVTVYAVDGIELGFNAIVTGNSGYNGTYENRAVRQFYFVNDSINLTGLTVYVTYNNGASSTKVTEGYVTNLSNIDMSVAGKKEVKISWGDSETIVASFYIFVAQRPTITNNTVTVKVDASVAEDQIGVAKEGVYQFRTIQQSLEFLGALGLDDNVQKIINLAEGRYFEKVEVTLPNVAIIGSADATKTIIEYDALYGDKDESGYEHTTDSTATLNVRVTAVGFSIEGVTISNAWNSTAYFDEHKGAGYGEHRALAMLIQADKVVIDNCRLLGYQDTIEFFTGRQYVLNTFIQGRTDFIFGTNNTTYFYNCEIHSIVDSGYITAFKGNNKGATDAVLYGAIFDSCNFTAADAVTKNDTAIGRPWGAYAAVAVINSTLGGHISTEASSGKSSGERYVAMSGNMPYDETVKFVEYNNTGAGAISEEIKGMRMLTAEEAANYSNLSVIFGTTNGGVTYTSAWDGSKGSQITEKIYKFSDYYTAGDAYNSSHAADNDSLFGGDATVVSGTWGHELNQNKDHAKFSVGTVIKFNKVGEVTVTTYGGNYGLPENVQITYTDGYATLTIVATESSPIGNGCYITEFKLDMSKTV